MPSMLRALRTLVGFVTLARLEMVAAASGYAEGRVLVRFKPAAAGVVSVSGLPGLAQQRVNVTTALAAAGASSRLSTTSTHVFQITDGKSVKQKVEELKAMQDVLVAEPDYEVQLFASPSDMYYAEQWHHPKISSPVAWDTTTGSSAVKVCVIDSGMRIDHPDLAGNVLTGWNVIPLADNGSYPQPGDPAWHDYNDTLRHGTHVAGIIGALGDNDRGVAGVAWRAALLPCRFIGDSGGGYISDAITCMGLCRAEGALVYSNSWGGVGESDILLAEISALEASNGLFVAAAGNNGANLADIPSYAFPAACDAPNQITVAATTDHDVLAGFSNFGAGDRRVALRGSNAVHLAAPGEQILSTTYDGGYGTMSGTSMATPVVAGAAALLQSMALSAGAPLAPRALRQLLMSTVDPIVGGSSTLVSGGRLNVARAVQQLKAQLPGARWPISSEAPSAAAPATSPLPQVAAARAPTAPPPPPRPQNGTQALPQCGASPLRGQPATQSSVLSTRVAGNAVNGDCRSNATGLPTACASTDPSQSDPWWAVTLKGQSAVAAVALTTRTDCCSDSISGAQVFVGNGTWGGAGSAGFAECGRVASTGLARGQRIDIACSQAFVGDSIAVYLPKLMTSLTLCEVDAALTPAPTAAGLDASPQVAATAPPSSQQTGRRRSRAMLHSGVGRQ